MLTQVIPRAVLANILILAVFGIMVPYVKGIEFLDMFILLPYSFLGLFFVIPMSVDAVFGSRERKVGLGGLFRAIGVGWFAGICVFWMGIATVSFKAGRLIAPPVAVGLCLAVLSLLGCVLAGALSAATAVRSANAVSAKGRVRIGYLVVLLFALALPRFLSDDANFALLQWLTPEGMVRATLVLAPMAAIASVAVLARFARQTTPR